MTLPGRVVLAQLLLVCGCAAVTSAPASAQAQGQAAVPAGATLFNSNCASCHTSGDPRTPTVDSLRQLSTETIVDALTFGAMLQQGASLSAEERRAIASFLVPPTATGASASRAGGSGCAATTPFDPESAPKWNGWGPEASNMRYQSAERAGITPETVGRLKLKWAFGFVGATSARSQPTVGGGRVFVGSQSGTVSALDAKTGCSAWSFKAMGGVRTAIVVSPPSPNGRTTVFFGDERSNVYALDARTGEQRWTRKVETHPNSHIIGAPTLYEGVLYVPVSSQEEGQGNNPRYECCTFRGSVVALNTADGTVKWKSFTIENEPRPLGRNRGGAVRWGPAGAAIWSSPTVDPVRRLIYVATGNMYTEPQQATADSVLAFDMATGKIAWHSQVTPNDVFVVGCGTQGGANCGDDVGPDFDFGNSPMLVTGPDGRQLIVVGQKSGVGYALDPDKQGALVWQYRAGAGSALGGMEFGSASDGVNAYFPVADGNRPSAGELHAVNLATGERAWVAPPPATLMCGDRGRGCTPALLAAISVIPGVVFAGSIDGGFRAYSTKDGAVLWEFDSNRTFTTVNEVPAKGASLNGPGAAIADGMVYVNSGYGALGGRPGNVLLAFGID